MQLPPVAVSSVAGAVVTHPLKPASSCTPTTTHNSLVDEQERRETQAAATTAAEEGARLALKAQEHAAKLRQEALKEREELAKKKGLTFSQKVRRRRPGEGRGAG